MISSCFAWPVAWTSSRPECTTFAPSRMRPSITFVTLISLPGIGWELRMTVSPSPISSQRFSRLAIRVRADIGSPWLPVEMMHTSPSGWSPTFSMSTSDDSGIVSRPISRARRTFFFIDRPIVATLRLNATAASAICCTRWMWLAKQAMTMRRPSCSWNRS